MLVFLFLKPGVQFSRNDLLDANSPLTSEGIVLAVASVVHVVSSHVTSNLAVLVKSLQLLTFWVFVILEGYWIVCQAE